MANLIPAEPIALGSEDSMGRELMIKAKVTEPKPEAVITGDVRPLVRTFHPDGTHTDSLGSVYVDEGFGRIAEQRKSGVVSAIKRLFGVS